MNTILWFSTNGLALALSVKEKMYEICLSLDGIVYTFINFLFKLFLVLARANIFSNDETYKLVGRIYQLVGVIMLFIFTYAMLRKIVAPDGKDKDSPSKIVFNIVKAIVLLAIVPSIFSYAFQIQEAILRQNTIGKVILGTSGNNTGASNPNEVIDKGGVTMAQGVFEAFLFPTNGDKSSEVMSGITYQEMEEEVQHSGNFSVYQNSAGAVENGTLTYYWGISLIGGAVVIYMLISYCISLGFRIIKLAFYEIMAPVCIIASILPSQKEMLSRWVKSTLSVFTEVFIRIAILFFITYIIQVVKNSMAAGQIFPTDLDFKLKALGFAAIIMGLVTFMKSAPDLISKLTGIESGNMSLGIRDQLAKGGFFTAGAVAGGALLAGARKIGGGASEGFNKWRKANSDYKKNIDSGMDKGTAKASRRKARASAVGTGLKGAGLAALTSPFSMISGGAKSFNKDAKSWKDMTSSAKKGATEVGEARQQRKSYIAKRGGTEKGFIGAIKNYAKAGKAYIGDKADDALSFVGIAAGADAYKEENAIIDEILSKKKATDSEIFSLIDGDLAAGKDGSAYSSTAHNMTGLKKLKAKMDMVASLKVGDMYDDGSGSGPVALTLDKIAEIKTKCEDDYFKYRKAWKEEIQDIVAGSEATWESQNADFKSDLAGARRAVANYKKYVANHLGEQVVRTNIELAAADAGESVADVVKSFTDDSVALKLTGSGNVNGKLKERLNDNRTKNEQIIANIMEKKSGDSSDGGKK